MTPTPPAQTGEAQASSFERDMIAAGKDPAVAAELERRIQIIERDELRDESRRPFSAREIVAYVAVSVVAVVIGALSGRFSDESGEGRQVLIDVVDDGGRLGDRDRVRQVIAHASILIHHRASRLPARC